jgi:hypothetical protein
MIDDSTKLKILQLQKKGFSQSEIGKALGVSKNTVAGQLARIKARGGLLSLDKPVPEDSITIFQLREDTCMAIIGEHRYCGCKVFKLSNCEKHYKEYRQPERKRK